MKNILSIIKKELRSYFDSPTAYITLLVFLLLWEFLFFRGAFLTSVASLHNLFSLLPWIFLILVPALTMGSISQERSEGTLELLLTHPLTEKQLVLGKFFASLIFVAIALMFVFPIAISLDNFGDLDWGVVFGQYLGGIFLAMLLASLGVFISSLFANQISSLLVTASSGFLLLIIGFELITASLPLSLAPILSRLSALSHYSSMARGVIDFRDVWYFISATLIFLALTYLWMLKRKFGNRKILYGKYQLGVFIFIAVTIVSNFVGASIPGRIDLTQDKLYTLTSATKNTLSNLESEVVINLYLSEQLPTQMQTTLREVKDILRDYETTAKGKITVFYKNPQTDQTILEQALSEGIREVQFNVVEDEGFQLKKGFFGLSVKRGAESESIAFIQSTNDLEYQLTGFISKVTRTDKKKIAFFAGHGEKGKGSGYDSLMQELEKQFLVEELRFETSTSTIPDDTSAIVIAGPTQVISENARAELKNYIDNGGAVLALLDSMAVNPQALAFPIENANNFSDFFEEYGVNINKDLIYDLKSNETVSFGGGFITYTLPYPLWPRLVALDETSPLTSKVDGFVVPWASSIELDDSKINELGFSAKKIFGTTDSGGRQTEDFNIDPNNRLPNQNLNRQIVAVTITKSSSDESAPLSSSMRLVVISDSDFLTDQFAGPKFSNLAFGIEAISWLAEEESLAGIQLRQRKERTLTFENNTQKTIVKYGNLGLALLLPLSFGGFRAMRRKSLRKARY